MGCVLTSREAGKWRPANGLWFKAHAHPGGELPGAGMRDRLASQMKQVEGINMEVEAWPAVKDKDDCAHPSTRRESSIGGAQLMHVWFDDDDDDDVPHPGGKLPGARTR